jgi:hypothetical protein
VDFPFVLLCFCGVRVSLFFPQQIPIAMQGVHAVLLTLTWVHLEGFDVVEDD